MRSKNKKPTSTIENHRRIWKLQIEKKGLQKLQKSLYAHYIYERI